MIIDIISNQKSIRQLPYPYRTLVSAGLAAAATAVECSRSLEAIWKSIDCKDTVRRCDRELTRFSYRNPKAILPMGIEKTR